MFFILFTAVNGNEKIGSIFYNRNRKLGSGSLGTVVFRGTVYGRDVAVKRYLRSMSTTMDREKALLLESDAHPNIVKYYASEISQDYCFLALQLCQSNIEEFVEGKYVNPNVNMVKILKDVLTGLSHLHNMVTPIVHRDVKPSNALIFAPNSDVEPIGVLADLRLSKQLDISQESFTMSGDVGSLGYMAPELLIGDTNHETSKRAYLKIDIYSSGLLLFFGLTNGYHPFGKNRYERTANIVENNSPDLSRLEGNISRYSALIKEMLSFNYEERPSATTVLHRFSNPGT